jgi:hypothetical protein
MRLKARNEPNSLPLARMILSSKLIASAITLMIGVPLATAQTTTTVVTTPLCRQQCYLW